MFWVMLSILIIFSIIYVGVRIRWVRKNNKLEERLKK